MKIVVVPASPKTTTAAIRFLLERIKRTDSIVGVYRDASKAPKEFTSRKTFTAVQGDVSDPSTLDFTAADAVIMMTPPATDTTDLVGFARKVSQNVREKVEEAESVKNLVLVSSVGAHLSEKVGELLTNHAAEVVFRDIKIPHVTLIRCGYFMENWGMFSSGLKEDKPYFNTTITPLDFKIGMVAVEDIGEALAENVLNPTGTSPHIFGLDGPRDYSSNDVKDAFSKRLGKNVEVRPIQPDDFEGFYGAFMPKDVAALYSEMSRCFLPGGYAYENPPNDEAEKVRGKTELQTVIDQLVQ